MLVRIKGYVPYSTVIEVDDKGSEEATLHYAQLALTEEQVQEDCQTNRYVIEDSYIICKE